MSAMAFLLLYCSYKTLNFKNTKNYFHLRILRLSAYFSCKKILGSYFKKKLYNNFNTNYIPLTVHSLLFSLPRVIAFPGDGILYEVIVLNDLFIPTTTFLASASLHLSTCWNTNQIYTIMLSANVGVQPVVSMDISRIFLCVSNLKCDWTNA